MATTKNVTTKKAAKAAINKAAVDAAAPIAPEAALKIEKTNGAAKKSKKAAAPKAPNNDASSALEIHINKTGRVCFGRAAAARIGDMAFMTAIIEGKQVRLVATAKQADGSLLIRRANGRPYLSATKLLKPLGFDGTKALDIEAKAYNSHGFEFKMA